jgi:uncharacterized SAM-binding protein YcdF (DUF218 family)
MKRRPLRLGVAALALVGALGGGFVWFLNQATAATPEPTTVTDGIAVLTGGADRVHTGLQLLAEGRARLLLVSGAHRDATLADLGRGAGLELAGLAGRITVGRAAVSTRGNAAEVAAWARANGVGSIRVVTAAYHMPRALLELRRALPDRRLVPHPVTPAALRGVGAVARWRTWSLLAGEYVKYLVARAGLSRFAAERFGGNAPW